MDTLLEHCRTQTLAINSRLGKLHGEFCVASLPLTLLKENAETFLHPQEFSYFKTLQFERRQHSYLIGRYVAKQAISRLTNGVTFKDILIKEGIFQYPVVYYPGAEKLQVSYSHSDNTGVAVAFPEIYPMGIDLEEIDFEKKEIIETQLTQEERQIITSLVSDSSEKLAILFWTIKEALSKVLRTGMMTPFEVFAIKKIEKKNNYWHSEFKNFAQYQVISFEIGKYFCSIVFSIRTDFELNIHAIQTFFANKPPH